MSSLPATSPTPAAAGAGDALRDEVRLLEVRRILQAGPRAEHLDRLTSLAAELLTAPHAQISLLSDEQFVWSLHRGAESQPGVDRRAGTPASDSLCTVTMELAAPLAVGDTRTDARVSTLPPVVHGGVQAYLGVPLLTEQAVAVGALCVYDDVPRSWTPRDVGVLGALAQAVMAELELRALTLEAGEDAARLELALTAAEIGSFDLDVSTQELRWDERLMRLFGYDPETFVPHLSSFEARLHPEDLERVAEAVQHAVETAGELAVEYRIVRPGGSVRWVEARGRVLGVKGSQRLLGVAYDSTQLREARDRLSRLLETMTDAFYSLDHDFRFTYVNRQAEVLLGRRRDELLGARLWDAFPQTLDSPFEWSYRGALTSGEPVVFEAPYAPLDGYYELSAWPGPDGLSVYFREVTARRQADLERERAVVERERAYATAEAANQRLQLLADASTRLAASLQPREVLETLSDLVVPRLCRWTAVALVNETAAALQRREPEGEPSRLVIVHTAHAVPEAAGALREVMEGLTLSTSDRAGVGAVVRTGRPEWLAEVPDDVVASFAEGEERTALRSVVVGGLLTLPLVNRGRVIGAMSIGEPLGGVVEQGLLESITERVAVALDNALLFADQARVAETLQRSLLPRDLPALPGVVVAPRYLPGATGAFVGGDWYQGVQVGDRLLLAMGDVMGHGMRSAARMGQLRAIVATLALEGHGPSELLSRLARNSDVLLDLELATLLVAVLDPRDGTLCVASAGHPPPVVAPPDGSAAYLPVEPGPPLGTFPGTYAETCVRLAPGSTLVLYTDGLVEQRDASLDTGLEQLRAAMDGLRLPPDAAADHVLAAMGRTDGADDDVALLVLSWDGARG
ncbi:MAG: putative sensor protein [Frankiales bacterium]|nr:putative sensor protein [Frankiales bacterium]